MISSFFNGRMGFLIVLSVISAVSWFLVLNQTARRKLVRGHWSIFGWSPFKISEQQREIDEILTLVSLLITALISTTVVVFVMVVRVVKLLT